MRARWPLVAMLVVIAVTSAVAVAPGPPANLSAVVAGNTVTLTWQPPTGGSPPLAYLVEAALSPGGPQVAAFLVIEPTIVLNAVPNGVYYLRVRAGNAEGISAASNEAIVSVPGGGGPCAAAPNPAANLSATVSGSAVTLTWRPATTGCAASGFVVQAGSAPGLSEPRDLQCRQQHDTVDVGATRHLFRSGRRRQCVRRQQPVERADRHCRTGSCRPHRRLVWKLGLHQRTVHDDAHTAA